MFVQMFRTLHTKRVTVELQNDVVLRGILESSDHFGGIRLGEVEPIDIGGYSELANVTSVFIRGPNVRYISIDPEDVDLELLHDATRRHNQARRD